MQMLWWHWMALGLILAMMELALPSFFIIWFGLGALLVGLIVLIMPEMSMTVQLLIWTIASVSMTALWFKLLRGKMATRAGQAAAALGEIGVLVRSVEAFGKGEVRFQAPIMGSDTWTCLSDEAIAAGERVKVISVDGQLLKVAKP